MDKITYDITQKTPSEGIAGIRIKGIALNVEMPDGKEYNIVLNNVQETMVSLKTKTYGHFQVPLSDIVMICPPEKHSAHTAATSNNKVIYFRNRRPDILHNFSTSHDLWDKLGIPHGEFVAINRGCCVNRAHILQAKDHTVTVEFENAAGQMEKKTIGVSRSAWRNINKLL